MPNWCSNELIIRGDYEKVIEFVRGNDNAFDLNKIVPEPVTKEECIERYGKAFIDDGNCHLMHDDGKEWFNWYEWHTAYWGSKWNSCNASVSGNTICFDTAWCHVEPAIDSLATYFPECEFEYLYSEPGCDFSGRIVYYDGEQIENACGYYGEFHGEPFDDEGDEDEFGN